MAEELERGEGETWEDYRDWDQDAESWEAFDFKKPPTPPPVTPADPPTTSKPLSDKGQPKVTAPQARLGTFRDIEKYALTLCDSIDASPAKSLAWLRFLTILLEKCSPRMDEKDLVSLEKKVEEAIKAKTVMKREVAAKVSKATKPSNVVRNFQDELDIFDGVAGDSGDRSSASEEDYDAF